MIDKLVLRCKFKDIENFKLFNLPIPLEGSLAPNGRLEMVRHPWERIPSSFAPVAFKVFDLSMAKEPDAYIELKASPAKVAQGHNIWGTDDLAKSAETITSVFFHQYPEVADLLNFSTWEVVEADITYHSRAESVLHAIQFITALGNVSKGQTRARHGYSSTAYFGKKNSRLKKIKVYEKWSEVIEYLKKIKKQKDGELLAESFTDELIEYCKGIVRWEVTIKKRWLERRGISNKLVDLCKTWEPVKFWKEATKEIRDSLEGEKMNIYKDHEIEEALKNHFVSYTRTGKPTYRKALGAFSCFRSLKDHGWIETQRLMSRMQFNRYVEMLHEIGVSRAVLQNLHTKSATVIPMVRYINVDFAEQAPSWANVA